MLACHSERSAAQSRNLLLVPWSAAPQNNERCLDFARHDKNANSVSSRIRLVARLRQGSGGEARAMLDKLVLEIRGQFGREIIHLDDHPADPGEQKIVTEHWRDRDT